MSINKLILGDNLEILKTLESESIDLIYLKQGFKAAVMIDKEGKQTAKFKAGLHNIAVKVVDNDGLESIEVVKLKVNGVLVRENSKI
jgi:hypothetical protein